MTSQLMTPEAVIQEQLDAYNARDLNRFLALFSEDAQMFEHPDTLLVDGIEGVRERYTARFKETNLHAKLLNRIVQGNIVIDQEHITRTFPEGTGTIDMIMIYEVQDGKIVRAWSIGGQKTLD